MKRGEIYFVNLNPAIGREQQGRRPVLVVSVNKLNRQPLVVSVIIGTSGKNVSSDYPSNVRITSEDSGLPEETVFYGFQLRSLDHSRFPIQSNGSVSDEVMGKIEDAIRYCLGL